MVRFVGRNDVGQVHSWIAEWATTLAGWMGQNLHPIIFTHSPDDAFAPEFARILWQAIREQVTDLPTLPAWAGDLERSQRKTQRTLFS